MRLQVLRLKFGGLGGGAATLITETGGFGNRTTTAGLPNFEGLFKNPDALSLSQTTTKVALSFPSGSIANFGVDTESQFRQITFTLTPAGASKPFHYTHLSHPL